MTQAVAEQNGLFAEELEPVMLDLRMSQLSSPVVFKPLTAVPLTVVGMAVHGAGSSNGGDSAAADGDHAAQGARVPMDPVG